jgi:hypothetical protein
MKEYEIPSHGRNVHIRGRLVGSDDPRDLSQDMAEVTLRNGINICIGWSREVAAGGAYLVEVISGLNDVVPPIAESNVFDALQTIANLILKYDESSFSSSDADGLDLKLPVAA